MTAIRPATEHDIPAMVDLGRLMHAESPRFSAFPFSAEKCAGFGRALLAAPGGVLLVAEDGGDIVGMLAGFVVEHFFSTARTASDAVVFVRQDRRGGTVFPRLVRAFEEAAVALGADEMLLGVSTEVHADATAHMYARMGFQDSGRTMRKRYV